MGDNYFQQDQFGIQQDMNNNNAESAPKKKNLISLTIKQIHSTNADSDRITYCDYEIEKVNFVAYIVEAEEKQDKNLVAYLLDDSTGKIWARQWQDPEEETQAHNTHFLKQRQEQFKQGRQYVRVIGSIKSFQDKKSIQVSRIQALTDPNEINYHHLDVVHTYLLLQKGFVTQQNFGEDFGSHQNTSSNELHNNILSVVESNGSEDGCSFNYLVETLRIQPNDLREHVQYLVNEGHLYTTIDEDHFHCTN